MEALTHDVSSGTTLFCGQQLTFSCSANKTNFISLSIDGSGAQTVTFRRNSAKEAQLGPVTLNLIMADVDPDSIFLTNFKVKGLLAASYYGSIPNISCSDARSSDFIRLERESLCNTIIIVIVH